MGKGFRPLEEDPSSLQMKEDVKDRWIRSFRPPEGDPSSLLMKISACNTCGGFRPHEGAPSSLLFKPIATTMKMGIEFPSPRRGPIFSTLHRIL